jgi:septal ring factor EnvC (AmiA/AmiB activator)
LYAHNQHLLKKAGDAVKAGESIASVGNTGGQSESGLYFEIRFQGKAIDPSDWLARA